MFINDSLRLRFDGDINDIIIWLLWFWIVLSLLMALVLTHHSQHQAFILKIPRINVIFVVLFWTILWGRSSLKRLLSHVLWDETRCGAASGEANMQLRITTVSWRCINGGLSHVTVTERSRLEHFMADVRIKCAIFTILTAQSLKFLQNQSGSANWTSIIETASIINSNHCTNLKPAEKKPDRRDWARSIPENSGAKWSQAPAAASTDATAATAAALTARAAVTDAAAARCQGIPFLCSSLTLKAMFNKTQALTKNVKHL